MLLLLLGSTGSVWLSLPNTRCSFPNLCTMLPGPLFFQQEFLANKHDFKFFYSAKHGEHPTTASPQLHVIPGFLTSQPLALTGQHLPKMTSPPASGSSEQAEMPPALALSERFESANLGEGLIFFTEPTQRYPLKVIYQCVGCQQTSIFSVCITGIKSFRSDFPDNIVITFSLC